MSLLIVSPAAQCILDVTHNTLHGREFEGKEGHPRIETPQTGNTREDQHESVGLVGEGCDARVAVETPQKHRGKQHIKGRNCHRSRDIHDIVSYPFRWDFWQPRQPRERGDRKQYSNVVDRTSETAPSSPQPDMTRLYLCVGRTTSRDRQQETPQRYFN